VITAIATQLATSAVKVVTDRPRPSVDPAVALPVSDAFPSGHASTAVAAFCLLALLEPRRWALPLAVALALAIGLSRIALGVHWTSDVVAGWLLGAAFAFAALFVRSRR
jgi:undecaprenyl-diphosphatase